MEIVTNSGYTLYIMAGGAAAILLLALLLFVSLRGRGEAAAKAKREGEGLYQTVAERIADGVLLFDAETKSVLQVNDALCRLLGYDEAAEVEGKQIYDLVAHEREGVDEDIGAALGADEGGARLGERKYRRKDGTLAAFEVSAVAVLYEGRKVVCNVARDVTGRKEAEQRVREAEEYHRTLVEQIPAIVYIEDIETRETLYHSPQIESILGYSRDVHVEDPSYWAGVIHPDDRERVMKAEKDAVKRGSFKLEYRAYAKDGGVVWLRDEAQVVRDNGGKPRFWQGIVFDITGDKKVEDALRESEERYRSLLQLSPNGLAVQSGGRFVYMNDAGLKTLGASNKGEVIRKPVLDFVHGDYKQMVREGIRSVGRGEAVEPVAPKCVRLDGTVIDMEASAAPITYLGEPAAQMVLRDITGRKAAERETELRIGELSRSNAELEQFAHVISHDLRAPLRSLDGFSRILLEDYSDRLDEEGKDYLERIRASSAKLGGMVGNLLEFSDITGADMHAEDVDLSDIARSAAAELHASHPDRRVEVIIAGGLEAEGDRRMLKTVLSHLMDNAWKFTRRSPRARVVFGMVEQEGRPVYFVRDNGVGFDMAHAGKLFAPFQRLHSDEEFEGAGIGLAAASRIIDRHGGRVWAEGEPEKGATFYFTL